MDKQTRLEAALARLLILLGDGTGREFPDECSRTASAFRVPYEDLREVYDEHCARK